VIRGGGEGRARLAVLARVLGPTTRQLLDRVGLGAGANCLDVGCGGGDVTLEMARRVGPAGSVVGVDADGEILALARDEAARAGLRQVRYLQADAADLPGGPAYDLVYARFLLTHLRDPGGVLQALGRAARPGGAVAVEDIDCAGHVCHPPCPAFTRSVELYRAVVRRRGGDPDIGPKLPGLFFAAGLEAVQVHLVQPVALEGEAKSVTALTLEKVADAVAAGGLATPEEVAGLAAELTAFAADPRTLMSLPRIFQVWGRRAG
jgi:SAM-dependent methyltransferase